VPTLYIIAGSNGAGKSSTGPYLLPDAVIEKHPPFDGDKLKSSKQLEFRKQVKWVTKYLPDLCARNKLSDRES
jgi:ABC-type transport system involved in cytochrome bd biosynthesis fused ATPase/permease subunit